MERKERGEEEEEEGGGISRQVWFGSRRTGKVRDIYLTGSRCLVFFSLSPGPIGVRLRDI